MDTKHYLSQISVLDLKISNKIYEKTQLKNMLCSVPSCVKDVNVQTGHAADKTASTICKLVDMEREIDSMIDSFVDLKSKIIVQMEQLEFKYYNILFKRYVAQQQWCEIVDELHFTQRHVFKLHKEALNEFEKKFGSEYLDQ